MPLNKNLGKARIVSLGLQHVLAMYAGAILVPLIVGRALHLSSKEIAYLVAIDLLTCGIATLLQAWKNKFFGIGLPVVLGTSFVAVTPMIGIGTQYGMNAIYGSIITAGIFILIFSPFFGKLAKLFPPVVTGSVVTIIGVSLVPAGIKNMAGGEGSPHFGDPENLLLSFGVFVFILLINRFFHGFIRAISVLLGIIAGTIVAAFMEKVDFTNVANASWFHVPQLFYFGTPSFEWGPMITMTLVGIVIIIESTGSFFALSKICEQDINDQDLVRGYRAEGLSFILGGLFNAFPYSTFAQNVGLVQLTKIKTRSVVIAAGSILVLLGLIPKIAAFTTIIPTPVLGGAMVVMFGMVVSSGIKMLSSVDFQQQNNLLIVACSIALGLGSTVVPNLFAQLPQIMRILVGDGIVTGSLTAIILNLFFNLSLKEKPTVNNTLKTTIES
ncbi:nucleobase:cation symporter-2 family protein [Geobacillus kaustophilus]|uniref:nucleobase:cation symporter-2 family protein n=1 Tax=Geobacillus kaustophilus TaxID=1462 RepID=UPI0027DB7B40|nr:nucleobase:cation symporter-2 family protein [Geobacillus kaustophilus]WMJ18765.1 nucleobase:cation symporter-2 family protein [Geobacillus kaustophilus]